MKLARAGAAVVLLITAPWCFVSLSDAAATASPKKKKSTKKAPAKRKTTRRIPAPVVSPQAREAASEAVTETLAQNVDLPLENPAGMVPFFEMLHRMGAGQSAGPLSILHYGDSHTAADDWTGSLRALLQAQFGDGGAGYSFAGRPFTSYRRLDLKSGESRGWKSEGLLAKDGDGLNGLGGVSIVTSRPNEHVYLQAECSKLELFYLQQPDGGDLQLFDNGEPVEKISTSGELGAGYFTYPAKPGEHYFELQTLHRAPVRLFGWVTEKETGITYETLGINGAQASIAFRWDEGLLASNIARRNPALIVLAYGTNEAGNPDWTQESYQEMFGALIRRFRQAAPTASILVLGPPDRDYRLRGRWEPYSKIDRIVAAQREAALANRCAFWDMREKMGGKGAMQQWVTAGLAQYDHVHFTAPGYRRLGYTLFRDLMYNYEQYSKVRQELASRVPNEQTNEDR